MRIVIQRVTSASVSVDGHVCGEIGFGMMVLVGIAAGDTETDIDRLAAKTVTLRIFDDEAGVMNRSVTDAGGDILAVSQFTLLADTRKGHRPSYINAMRPPQSQVLYERYCKELERLSGRQVRQGVFGADMKVSLVNDGPVTIVMES